MDEAEGQFLLEIVSKATKLPGVKVDLRAFLAKTFNHLKGTELARLVEQGPQSLYKTKDLIKVANRVVLNDTEKSTVFSFAAGLPSNPVMMAGVTAANSGLMLVSRGLGTTVRKKNAASRFDEDLLVPADVKNRRRNRPASH